MLTLDQITAIERVKNLANALASLAEQQALNMSAHLMADTMVTKNPGPYLNSLQDTCSELGQALFDLHDMSKELP